MLLFLIFIIFYNATIKFLFFDTFFVKYVFLASCPTALLS